MFDEYINICIEAITLLNTKKQCSLEFKGLCHTDKTKFPKSVYYLSCECWYNDKTIEMLIPEEFFHVPHMGVDTTAGIRDVMPLETRYQLRIAYEILQMLKEKDYFEHPKYYF